jgi:vacuolar-type H+-ATPase subunit H
MAASVGVGWVAAASRALVSHSQYGRYLRRYAADFVIQDYINFISRRNPAGKSYWEGYNDGPRKYSFVHVMCSGFMAYLARPATQAKLQRLQQAQDARLAAATQPTPTEAAMTNAAKETCRRMIEEAQKRADIMLEKAQQQALEIIARAHEGTSTGQDEFIHLISDDEDEDNPTGDETIRFMSDEDEDEGNDT